MERHPVREALAYVHPSELLPRLAKQALGEQLARCQSLLDIGGGSGVVGESNWREAGVNAITVIDAWDGYDWAAYNDRIKFHCMQGQYAINYFGGESFDIVQCCECIEHMPKEEGRKVLADMREIARYFVVLTCPDGYTFQEPEGAENEPWRHNQYQRHLCGWFARELEDEGYQVYYNGGDLREDRIHGAQLVAYYKRAK